MGANISNLTTVTPNVIGAPEGCYISRRGYSDRTPFMVTRISPTGATVWARQVECVETEEWLAKMESHPGGFARHVSNQGQQQHRFVRLIGDEIQIRIGSAKAARDWLYSGAAPFRFYDYNF